MEETIKDKLKKYIREPWFKTINDFANICDLNGDEESILNNIKDYIFNYILSYGDTDINKGVENFIQFLDSFCIRKQPGFTENNDGKILTNNEDLLYASNGYHIYGDFRLTQNNNTKPKRGFYMAGAYMGTDGYIYLAKDSMNSKQLSIDSKNRKQIDYNSIIGQAFFEYFGQPVAEYYLLKNTKKPYNLILTKNFLTRRQELIHFDDLYEYSEAIHTHGGRISNLEKNMRVRYERILGEQAINELINKLKLQYCKQQFMKLLIGPMDSNLSNTALVLTIDDDSNIPQVDISPAYDLDLSFNVSEDLMSKDKMFQMKTSDGQDESVHSIIQEFRDIKGFDEFMKQIMLKLNNKSIAEEIVNNAYNRTGFEFFRSESERYISFMNQRFEKLREAYRQIYEQTRGDEEK